MPPAMIAPGLAAIQFEVGKDSGGRKDPLFFNLLCGKSHALIET
jgi:hypothetical protein